MGTLTTAIAYLACWTLGVLCATAICADRVCLRSPLTIRVVCVHLFTGFGFGADKPSNGLRRILADIEWCHPDVECYAIDAEVGALNSMRE